MSVGAKVLSIATGTALATGGYCGCWILQVSLLFSFLFVLESLSPSLLHSVSRSRDRDTQTSRAGSEVGLHRPGRACDARPWAGATVSEDHHRELRVCFEHPACATVSPCSWFRSLPFAVRDLRILIKLLGGVLIVRSPTSPPPLANLTRRAPPAVHGAIPTPRQTKPTTAQSPLATVSGHVEAHWQWAVAACPPLCPSRWHRAMPVLRGQPAAPTTGPCLQALVGSHLYHGKP